MTERKPRTRVDVSQKTNTSEVLIYFPDYEISDLEEVARTVYKRVSKEEYDAKMNDSETTFGDRLKLSLAYGLIMGIADRHPGTLPEISPAYYFNTCVRALDTLQRLFPQAFKRLKIGASTK